MTAIQDAAPRFVMPGVPPEPGGGAGRQFIVVRVVPFQMSICIDNVGTLAPPAYWSTAAACEAMMKVLVKKWGNSASVRIPASVMAATRLSLDQVVDVREEAGRIIIEPIREEVFDLDDLVAGITDENRHDSVDFGIPAGREIW